MKEKLIDEIKEIFSQSGKWVKLELEYVKLTAAEKFTVLLSTLILGAICLLIATAILILLAMACVDLFEMILTPPLACLCVAGILVVLMGLVFIFRKPLLLNPIAKFITRLFFDHDQPVK